MRIHAKRWLFLVHRWVGVVACAFFAMWFVSGMVMMYVGYPKLTEAERLAHLPSLDVASPVLPPLQALRAAGIGEPIKELRLAQASGGRAVYLATPLQPAIAARGMSAARGAGVVVVDALTGERLPAVDAPRALAAAAAYAGPGVGLRYEGTIDEDSFTHSRDLDAHRPLHRVQLTDADATLLYISGETGEVVCDAPRAERLWNYVGTWIHWMYPLRGNIFDGYWAAIVEGMSIIGIVTALTGAAVGLLRWRFRHPYRNGARSPYQGRVMRWHHMAGLLFALTTITWIFSGLMSMNPWKIFDSGGPPLRTEVLQGGALSWSAEDATPQALLAATGAGVRELRWVRILGRTTALAQRAQGRPALFDPATAKPRLLDAETVRAAASHLMRAPVAHIDRLDAYDLYYYSREAHTMTGGTDKPLPVLRVVFADTHATWVHVDPHTGTVLGRTDGHRRTSRWLFAMLHSWDWLPLLNRRPLWDIVLLALSLGGAALSLTAVAIGWRRLGRKLRALRFPTVCPPP
ncbi:PepSY domain-containing protein [Xylophilus ampelinus]|uniref:Putative iron-regulated membrane protein n=1 Tax=Xylophilus ampelinus TaxID=54067 RepID=A0A318SGN9_9BURK|nr:PepSY domain-containing protein [Xylophilus ampelinus]MCS4510388.1 PepSY domain-containing protein [Xylophilus ampelinus]PYE77993.1 putative iron-regulated membrane protein [Xylophilus ampelinus]